MSDWTEPGVYEVVPGVVRIPLPLPNDGLKAVNVYALVGGDRLTFIDGGWWIPQAREVLLAALDRLGHTPSDIERFLVTHLHRDHYTLAVTLRKEYGGTVALGEGEKHSLGDLMRPEHRPLEQQLDLLRSLGATELADSVAKAMTGHRPDQPEWEEPDEWLTAGTTSAGGRTLEIVPTPGHTRGHVVYHDVDNALLFAGDHVLPTITPSIGFEPVPSVSPLGEFLDSLALMRSRPDAMLLPAHGAVTDSVHARVDQLIAHHGQRLDETEAAVRAGASTPYDAACVLKWTRRGRSLDELDPFNQMLAIAETAAHLQLLEVQGRVTAQLSDGVRHYT